MSNGITSLLRGPGKWLESIGQTYGLVFAFAIAAFLEATFIPLVIDMLMFTFLMTGTVALWRLIAVGTLASLIGTSIFWIAGIFSGPDSLNILFNFFEVSPEIQAHTLMQWENNWIGTTFLAGLTAIPDPAIAFLAGSTKIPAIQFLPVLTGVLLLRFSTLGGIVWIVSKFFNKTETSTKTAITGFSLLASVVFTILGLIIFFL